MRSHGSSDRRRRFVAFQSLQQPEPAPRVRPTLNLGARAAIDPPGGPEVDVRLDKVPAPLRRLMTRQESTVWLFAGESCLPVRGMSRRKWRNYVEHFQRFIQEQLGRRKDVVIDATTPECYLSDLAAEYPTRVGRFRPDAVFVGVGSQEALRGVEGLESFESALEQVVNAVLRTNCQCVVQTPPCLSLPGTVGVAELIGYVEAVRDAAEAGGLSLIDHWKHWEFSAVEGGGVSNWCVPKYGCPGEVGHKQLAKTIIDDLGIRRRRVSDGVSAGLELDVSPQG